LRDLIGELPVELFSQLGEKAYADCFSTLEAFNPAVEPNACEPFDVELRALA
jgi:hypothetical protein